MTDEALLIQVRNTKNVAYRERLNQYGEGHGFTSDVLRDCVTLLGIFEERLTRDAAEDADNSKEKT